MASWPIVAAVLATVNPYQLEVGPRRGQMEVPLGWTNMVTQRASSPAEVARMARGARFVLVGESHETLSHHQAQADVIEALVKDGRRVILGMEYFWFDRNKSLAPWTLGWQTEEEFVAGTEWQTQWGYKIEAYRPLFAVTRKHQLRMVGLNVPRDWVRTVSRGGGVAALSAEQRAVVPRIDVTQRSHRAFFEALIGGHPMGGPQMDNFYAAQVLWDEGMAASALRVMEEYRDPNAVMVIVGGFGHVGYDTGINLRIRMTTGERVVNVVCLGADAPASVSRGLADVVFRAEAPAQTAPAAPAGDGGQ